MISSHPTKKKAFDAAKALKGDVLRHNMSDVAASNGVTTTFPATRVIDDSTGEEINSDSL